MNKLVNSLGVFAVLKLICRCNGCSYLFPVRQVRQNDPAFSVDIVDSGQCHVRTGIDDDKRLFLGETFGQPYPHWDAAHFVCGRMVCVCVCVRVRVCVCVCACVCVGFGRKISQKLSCRIKRVTIQTSLS